MTRTEKLRRTLMRRWLTPLEAATLCGVFALGQRCNEWRRAGEPVESKWVKTPGGARVLAWHWKAK